jgi:glycosyltransferase involved in cell wall biosynthesis
MGQSKKVAYFLSHPIQYFSPLLREMAKEFDMEVFYFSRGGINSGTIDKGFAKAVAWDTPLFEGYNYQFVKNYSRSESIDNHFFDVFNPGLLKILWKSRFSIIIVNGWNYSSTLIAIFFGRLFGKKIWLRAENPVGQEKAKNKAVLAIKKLLLKYVLFRFFVSKCLYIGSENKLFFEFYGVPLSKLVFTPYAVDNAFFTRQFELFKNDLIDVKQALRLPGNKKIILFTGKYIEKKNPLDLIRAFHMLNDPDYALVMVGEGPLRAAMENYLAVHNLEQVYLTGFVNQALISRYYAVADLFVMCSGSGETWGLSVNEAMNFSKPVIVSKTCGCAPDLVQEGKNGFTFSEGDVAELAGLISKVLGDGDFRIAAGKKSAEIISQFSISHIVHNMKIAQGANAHP